MKKINIILLMFAVFLITISSCTKDPKSETETTNIPTEIDNHNFNPLLDNIQNRDDLGEGLELGCFTIDTPFSLDVDGTIIEINSFEDLENAFEYDSTEIAINVDFVYPIYITYEDGETAELANSEALGEAFSQCVPDQGWEQQDSTGFDGTFPAFLICDINSCYQLIYPVTLIDPEGITYLANSENEFIELLSTQEFLAFQFPVSLEGTDGTVTAQNGDTLFDLLIDCQEDPWDGGVDVEIDSTFDIGGIACYNLLFPVTFSTENGGETVLNNEEEFSAAMLNGNLENFVYPVSLINIETTEITIVNSDDEFSDAVQNCWDFDNGGGQVDPPFGENAFLFFISSNDFEGDCYAINYPVDVITIDSTQLTYTSAEDFINALELDQNFPEEIIYPVSVTLNSNGETSVLEGAEDIFNLMEDCQ